MQIHLANMKHAEAVKLWPWLTAFTIMEARRDGKKIDRLASRLAGTKISWHAHVAFQKNNSSKYTITMFPPDKGAAESESD